MWASCYVHNLALDHQFQQWVSVFLLVSIRSQNFKFLAYITEEKQSVCSNRCDTKELEKLQLLD